MIRRFNYTQRRRITHDHLLIQLFQSNDASYPAFKASIDLSAYDFPPQATVYVEAYYKSSMMRFSYGRVAETASHAYKLHLLDELQSTSPYFRVKVVDERDDVGRLLAVADKIAPQTDEYDAVDKLSLIHVAYESLGHRIWQLDVERSHEMPRLRVNKDLTLDVPINEVVKTNRFFITLVFPQVVEQILSHIFFEAEDVDIHEGDWRALWMRYAMQLIPRYSEITSPDDLDDSQKEEWMRDIIERFCTKNDVLQQFTREINRTG